jgi:hypothetical protein
MPIRGWRPVSVFVRDGTVSTGRPVPVTGLRAGRMAAMVSFAGG